MKEHDGWRARCDDRGGLAEVLSQQVSFFSPSLSSHFLSSFILPSLPLPIIPPNPQKKTIKTFPETDKPSRDVPDECSVAECSVA